MHLISLLEVIIQTFETILWLARMENISMVLILTLFHQVELTTVDRQVEEIDMKVII